MSVNVQVKEKMQSVFKIDKYHFVLIVMVILSLLYNIILQNISNNPSFPSSIILNDDYNNLPEAEGGAQFSDEPALGANTQRIVSDGLSNIVTFSNGDTLLKVLRDLQVSHPNSLLIAKAINKVFQLSSIKAGEKVEITAYKQNMKSVVMSANPEVLSILFQDKKIIVRYDVASNIYEAELSAVPTTIRKQVIAGIVNDTFLRTAKKHGISHSMALEFIRMFSYDIDFQRDIASGTKFKILCDSYVNDKGIKIKEGKVHYAALYVKGKSIEIYRHEFPGGVAGYFYKDGSSIKKAFLKTPIKSAVISSGYGLRKHPMLGYSKVHRGLDYAAPAGTPVLAAADGTIEFVKNHNTYGKYIKIKHGNKYATLYAHLSRFAGSVKTGSKVRQGDVIGYVGSTGLATGPHLHYEVHVDGKQVNPAKVSIIKDVILLDKKQLMVFQIQQRSIQKILNDPSYASTYSYDSKVGGLKS